MGGLGPSAIALFLVARDDGWQGVKELLGRAFRFRLGYWYVPTILLIPILVIVAHALNAMLGGAWPTTELLARPWLIPALFVVFLVLQAGEEFGWRGYALDHLQKRWNALISSLIVGCCWALWHVPMFFIDGFGLSRSRISFPRFAITLITVSILITWIHNNSAASLVPAFVCHAMINLSAEVLPLHSAGAEATGPGAWTCLNILSIACSLVVLRVWGTTTMIRIKAV